MVWDDIVGDDEKESDKLLEDMYGVDNKAGKDSLDFFENAMNAVRKHSILEDSNERDNE